MIRRKKRVFLLLFIIITALSAQAGAVNAQSPSKILKQYHEGRYKAFLVNDLDLNLQALIEDSLHEYDALHLEISLDLQDFNTADSAQFTVHQRAASRVDGLESCEFNLQDANILNLTLGGTPVSYEQGQDVVEMFFPTALASGDTFEIDISYRVPIRYDHHNGGLIYGESSNVLYTDAEPYAARKWIACWDYPGDKVTMELTTRFPEEYLVLSNGVQLLDSLGSDGTRTTRWRSDDPISTYLISFAAHPYTVVTDRTAGVNNTEVHYWVYPDDAEDQTYDFGRTPDMIEVFEDHFGAYPFNKYDQAVAPIFGGMGAMEHQTATTFGAGLVGDGSRSYERIVSHELAHQWWGDCVGPQTFAEIWLNEGFASYGSVVWAESLSPEAAQAVLEDQEDSYFYEFSAGLDIPLYNPPLAYIFSNTVYDKGSRVLHMMRYLVGDSLFYEGLKEYASAYAYGSATTEGFRDAMSGATGYDFSSFFDQWVYAAGYPRYTFGALNVEETIQGWRAIIQLNQTQSSGPWYDLPLPIKLYGDGEDTTIIIPVAAIAEQNLIFSNLPFEPYTYQFDPEGWILARHTYDLTGSGQKVVQFTVENLWPNPAGGTFNVDVNLIRAGGFKANVYDLLGVRVADLASGYHLPGTYRFVWQADRKLASGVYFLRMQMNGEEAVNRMILLR